VLTPSLGDLTLCEPKGAHRRHRSQHSMSGRRWVLPRRRLIGHDPAATPTTVQTECGFYHSLSSTPWQLPAKEPSGHGGKPRERHDRRRRSSARGLCDLARRVAIGRVHTVFMAIKWRLCLALSGRFRYDVHDLPRVRFDVGCRDLPITGLRVDSLAVIALHHTMAVIRGYTVANRPCT